MELSIKLVGILTFLTGTQGEQMSMCELKHVYWQMCSRTWRALTDLIKGKEAGVSNWSFKQAQTIHPLHLSIFQKFTRIKPESSL